MAEGGRKGCSLRGGLPLAGPAWGQLHSSVLLKPPLVTGPRLALFPNQSRLILLQTNIIKMYWGGREDIKIQVQFKKLFYSSCFKLPYHIALMLLNASSWVLVTDWGQPAGICGAL